MPNLDPGMRPPRGFGDIWRKLRELEAKINAKTSSRQAVPNSEIPAGMALKVRGAVNVVDEDGNVRQVIGTQSDGTRTTVDLNAPPPAAPSAPILTPGIESIGVVSDGSTADGSPLLADFGRTDVHWSTVDGFTHDDTTRIASFHSPAGGSVTLVAGPGVPVFVKLVNVNTSGVESAPSVQATATPNVAPPGPEGPAGPSAYEQWLAAGNSGTEADFLASLEGPGGDPGDPGPSAYEVAVANGFVGTEAEWLASLEGPKGDPGEPAPPVAPTVSPAVSVQGGVGVLFVRLPPIMNETPVVADVYVGATTPLVLDATTLHGTAEGTLYTIEALPDGSLLVYGATYYVVAVARNAAGSASPSAEASGAMRQVDTPDVSAEFVYAGTVTAGQVTSGTMEAEVVVGGTIESVGLAGERVGLSAADGFYSRGPIPAGGTPDQAPVYVHFPVDGKPNIVSGTLEAEKLTVIGGATFRSASNVEPQAAVTLESGVQPPKSGPAAVVGWDTTQHAEPTADDRYGLTKGGDGHWYTMRVPDGSRSVVEAYTDAGVLSQTWTLPDVNISGTNRQLRAWGGIVYAAHNGGRWYVYAKDQRPTGTQSWWLVVYDAAMSWIAITPMGLGAPVRTQALGWDFTNTRLLVAFVDASEGALAVYSYTVDVDGAATFVSDWPAPVGWFGYDRDLAFVARGSFDYGADRYVFRSRLKGTGAHPFQVYTTASSPTHQTGDEWPNRTGSPVLAGAWWDGTRFHGLDDSGLRTKYEGGRAIWGAGASSRWSFAYSWYDSTTTRDVSVTRSNGTTTIVSAAGYVFSSGDVGVAISGTGIQAGTTITTVAADGTSATMSLPATSSGTATATFTSTTQETTQSARSAFTMTKRARVTLTTNTIPVGVGGVNDPNAVRVYWGRGDTDATTTMAREKTLAAGATTFTFDPSATAEGGAAAAAFGNSTPGKLAAASGGFSIDGAGNGSVGTGTFRDSVDARADARIAVKSQAASVTATVVGTSGVATFSHTLGTTPTVVLPVVENPGGVRLGRVTAKAATTFDVQFRDNTGAFVANGTVVTIGYVAFA